MTTGKRLLASLTACARGCADYHLSTLCSGKERKLGLRGQKGLRHFSQLVCDKVEGKQVTTYSEVRWWCAH